MMSGSLASADIMGNAPDPEINVSAKDSSRLIWIDLEMTGLKTDTDHIIEIATIVTDKHLNVLAEGPVFAIHQPEETLQSMDDWNRRQHGFSGLADRVRASRVTAAQAED